MTVMQLNTQIYNSLGALSNDESYLKKAANYLKNLAAKKQEKEAEREKTKAMVLEGLDRAFKELKLHQEGKLEFRNAEDLINEL